MPRRELNLRYAGLKIGWGFTGSYCCLDSFIDSAKKVKAEGANIHIFASPTLFKTDTRFGKGDKWRSKLLEISEKDLITDIVEAEPYGPKIPLDLMIIAPLTGTSLAKLALGISDTPVLLAAKATIRNGKPILLAIATNDGLGTNAENIGKLLRTKNIFFVPFGQDDPIKKERSLIAISSKIPEAIDAALNAKQVQPILVMH